MGTVVEQISNTYACAWYVHLHDYFYAVGPYRFPTPVPASKVAEQWKEEYGNYPWEIYPTGPTEEVPEYTFNVEMPFEGEDA